MSLNDGLATGNLKLTGTLTSPTVSGSTLAVGATVGTAEIEDASIVSADIAAGTIVAANLADNTVTVEEMTSGTITNVVLAKKKAAGQGNLGSSGAEAYFSFGETLGSPISIVISATSDGLTELHTTGYAGSGFTASGDAQVICNWIACEE